MHLDSGQAGLRRRDKPLRSRNAVLRRGSPSGVSRGTVPALRAGRGRCPAGLANRHERGGDAKAMGLVDN